MMMYDPIIKSFSQHWKTLRTRMEESKPEVPKITKEIPPTRRSKAFLDFLSRYVGRRAILLSYVARKNVNLPDIASPLLVSLP